MLRKLLVSFAAAGALAIAAAPSVAIACENPESCDCDCDHKKNAKKEPAKLTIDEVASLQKAKKVTPVDANGEATRQKMGVIPGAVLLTSSSQFDPAKELPADKNAKLVFYCANTRCTAAGAAAVRAIEAGYTDVSVLPDGIKGWKDAGQPTDTPRS